MEEHLGEVESHQDLFECDLRTTVSTIACTFVDISKQTNACKWVLTNGAQLLTTRPGLSNLTSSCVLRLC